MFSFPVKGRCVWKTPVNNNLLYFQELHFHISFPSHSKGLRKWKMSQLNKSETKLELYFLLYQLILHWSKVTLVFCSSIKSICWSIHKLEKLPSQTHKQYREINKTLYNRSFHNCHFIILTFDAQTIDK